MAPMNCHTVLLIALLFCLIISDPPSGVRLYPSPVAKVSVTDDITLVCQALDGVPPPIEYRWKRNGQTISGGMDGMLLLSSVMKSENNDTYKCFAFNKMGTSSPGATNINVQCEFLLFFDVSLTYNSFVLEIFD